MFFFNKWRHVSCIMTSSIIPSLSILNIWRCGGLTALVVFQISSFCKRKTCTQGDKEVSLQLTYCKAVANMHKHKSHFNKTPKHFGEQDYYY